VNLPVVKNNFVNLITSHGQTNKAALLTMVVRVFKVPTT